MKGPLRPEKFTEADPRKESLPGFLNSGCRTALCTSGKAWRN